MRDKKERITMRVPNPPKITRGVGKSATLYWYTPNTRRKILNIRWLLEEAANRLTHMKWYEKIPTAMFIPDVSDIFRIERCYYRVPLVRPLPAIIQ